MGDESKIVSLEEFKEEYSVSRREARHDMSWPYTEFYMAFKEAEENGPVLDCNNKERLFEILKSREEWKNDDNNNPNNHFKQAVDDNDEEYFFEPFIYLFKEGECTTTSGIGTPRARSDSSTRLRGGTRRKNLKKTKKHRKTNRKSRRHRKKV